MSKYIFSCVLFYWFDLAFTMRHNVKVCNPDASAQFKHADKRIKNKVKHFLLVWFFFKIALEKLIYFQLKTLSFSIEYKPQCHEDTIVNGKQSFIAKEMPEA